ncbi:MAG: right-handed parallel beta-helix repeat-containing protein [Acidobacteriota bacterium]
MSARKLFLLLCCMIAWIVPVQASTLYVAVTGSDAAAGSLTAPFATIAKAVSVSVPGDTIYVRGGTYAVKTRISISKSGTAEKKIFLLAYPGEERPVLDFSAMAIGSSNQGVVLNGSYWHVKGLRIRGAGDNGLQISGGGFNTIEFCDFFENRDAGLQLKSGAHDNRIINCDSYWNADYVAGTSYDGGNADGFAPKLDIGSGNYFYGCRAWLNSDDGWDGFMYSDLNVTTTIERCWAWKNGYLKDGVTTTNGMNGNGFKTGGGGAVGARFRHNQVLTNCLAFNNKAKGFDQNHNVGSITILNCTAKSNGANNFDVNEALAPGCTLTVKNSLSYESNKIALLSSAVTASNNWTKGITVAAADFQTIDTAGVSAPRKPDGSLPDIAYLRPARGSRVIDAGTDIGLPFYGSAPDLGCFETDPATSVGYHPFALPQQFELMQNYPNPFNPETTFRFALPTLCDVSLSVYTVTGEKIASVVSGAVPAGSYSIRFDGSMIPSGVYFIRLQAGSFSQTRRMVLMK